MVIIAARETELRQLRKQTTELEEQNAILSKHIENMKQAIEKLQIEAVQQRNNNMALQGHLDALRTTLTSNFSTVPLPGLFSSFCCNWTYRSWADILKRIGCIFYASTLTTFYEYFYTSPHISRTPDKGGGGWRGGGCIQI